jgi:hypothetical protein
MIVIIVITVITIISVLFLPFITGGYVNTYCIVALIPRIITYQRINLLHTMINNGIGGIGFNSIIT